ncbi:hypothetical protein HNQ63_003061 [Wenzhouxiangella marina]|uniref:Uncharacterized protein n=1 Tax=Wenzhouxiangella marina TaxID=1579979 RepID=A0A0K0XYN6_9GAMM|nr:hypothetical protein WM2015_2374 [Wenzhouxiangella marina]MBB6088574.1 hypothetical protein [Wenzhouxiangella marina]
MAHRARCRQTVGRASAGWRRGAVGRRPEAPRRRLAARAPDGPCFKHLRQPDGAMLQTSRATRRTGVPGIEVDAEAPRSFGDRPRWLRSDPVDGCEMCVSGFLVAVGGSRRRVDGDAWDMDRRGRGPDLRRVSMRMVDVGRARGIRWSGVPLIGTGGAPGTMSENRRSGPRARRSMFQTSPSTRRRNVADITGNPTHGCPRQRGGCGGPRSRWRSVAMVSLGPG